MGVIAFVMDIIVSELTDLKWNVTEKVARVDHLPGIGWVVIVLFSVLYVGIASALTVHVAPSAAGSGVAEAMGMMNGVAYTDYISIKGLIVKIVGISLAVAGGICGGKEGPLVHIGSIVGYAVAYLPIGIT